MFTPPYCVIKWARMHEQVQVQDELINVYIM